tara:strand:- start:32874 stop:33104 length:231 start_codon:yes stop_codon:yes gene_type:complete
MKAKDIVIGESYRHKDHPTYAWAKAVKVLKPKQDENPHNRIIVKCEYSVDKNPKFGLIKYFKPSDLLSHKTKQGNE